MAQRLGDLRSKLVGSISSANVFPNLSFLPGQNSFRTWNPRGPHEIELRTWVLVNKGAPSEIKKAYRRGVMMTFSPSGVFEMDDGENWEFSTNANRGVVTRRQRLQRLRHGAGDVVGREVVARPAGQASGSSR